MGKRIQILSGGQTGVDRSALAWAVRRGYPHGGWCPRGRRAEDGPIPKGYRLRESLSNRYAQRTEWNVRDSDATVIFTTLSRLSGGTLKTVEFCRRNGRPCLILMAKIFTVDESARLLARFLKVHHVRRLNVAGPRASEAERAGLFARNVLDRTFGFT